MRVATSLAEIDRAVTRLGGSAEAFARTAAREKAALLRATLPRLLDVAAELAARHCRARGLDPDGPHAAEGWLGGPAPVVAYARALAEALEDIAMGGRPALSAHDIRKRPDGRVVARTAGRTLAERVASRDRQAMVVFAEGVEVEQVIAEQARFYRLPTPEGLVAAVVSATSDAASGMLDALYALFVEGQATLLALGEEAFDLDALVLRALSPLVERGCLEVVRAGPEEHATLAAHPGVGAVHFSGDVEDHGPIAAARKPGTTALGGVGPVILTPCLYAKDELSFLACDLAAAVAAGGSGAPRVLVLPRGWAQRELFLSLLGAAFREVPPRPPTSEREAARFAEVTAGHTDAVRFGERANTLPWTLLPDLDATTEHPIFTRTSAVGPVIASVSVGSDDPKTMLDAATAFCNERLGGSLGAQLVVHPVHEEDPDVASAVEQAVLRLRYGVVGLNATPGLVRLATALPWGGHPNAPGPGARSGSGFRNGALMLAGVDKSVLQTPLLPLRRQARHPGREAKRWAAQWTTFQAAPRLGAVWTVAWR